MLVDPTQPTGANLLPKLVQHPGPGPVPAQPAKPTPSGLFGQLSHDQIQRMRRSQHRQQMHAPQLRRTEGAASSAGELARAQIGDERVGHMRRNQIQQAVGPDGRKHRRHAPTLPEPPRPTNPPVMAKASSRQLLTRTFGTPSPSAIGLAIAPSVAAPNHRQGAVGGRLILVQTFLAGGLFISHLGTVTRSSSERWASPDAPTADLWSRTLWFTTRGRRLCASARM